MRPADARLDQFLGTGAAAFPASLDLVPDPLGVLWAIRDAAGAVIDFETGYANPAMDRMLGVSIERSFGRRLLAETPAFGDDETFKRMRGVVETGTPAVVETVVESRAGPIARLAGVFVHRAVPFGADGVTNLITDITSQRRLETELERYAQVAAHDLREPLMAIGLFVEQLAAGLDRGRDERNERLVELLRRSDARAKLLVDGILEYARYGTAVEFENVDMAVLVADVLDSLSAALLETGATVDVAQLPTIQGNAAQLSRVLQNLLANSLKFRSDQPPRVAIAAEHADGFWLFTVEDNGVGIPPELGDDAFAMFKRAHGDDYEGSGIGLAVCRKIVEAHGGAITATPAPDGGTTIRFSLPAIPARLPNAAIDGLVRRTQPSARLPCADRNAHRDHERLLTRPVRRRSNLHSAHTTKGVGRSHVAPRWLDEGPGGTELSTGCLARHAPAGLMWAATTRHAPPTLVQVRV